MVDMSIIDEKGIDVVALQKELSKLRKENQSLQQENARLKVWKNLAKEWMHDIDNLYQVIYRKNDEENYQYNLLHDKLMKMTNLFSTKKGKLLLKFLV